ncbi:MAG: FAD-dependent oxidoreductase [Myxococcales bacterium]|nr:FAD-dependent oxidoreductase [Myxococcales bacterium]
MSGEASRHVIAIIGGAIAGSEAAALAARRGALAVVFEQGARPYGKIEDGLPRWHHKLRLQEYGKIDASLDREGVLFVPCTRVGTDVSLRMLREELGFSAVILATGAWRDRPLPIPDEERFRGKGLEYQKPFVQWFNHYEESQYRGPRFEIPDGALVVGGGLASIDVAKILNLELFSAALRERGINRSVIELEQQGIDSVLEEYELSAEALGLRGCLLTYRRSIEDMPVASAEDASPERMVKVREARVKIMNRLMRRYLIRFEGQLTPVAPIVDGDRMAGLVFRRTEIVDGRVRELPGSEYEIRAPLTIASIGSIPAAIPGLPMRGELYEYEDLATGRITEGVFGLGNVLTGKGNIRISRESAKDVGEHILDDYLGAKQASAMEISYALHEESAQRVAPIVEAALDGRKPGPQGVATILAWVHERWRRIGYDGDYQAWRRAHEPR